MIWPVTRFRFFLATTFCGTLFFARLAPLTPNVWADDFQGATHMMPFDEGSNSYDKAVATNGVERLQKLMDAGEVTLT